MFYRVIEALENELDIKETVDDNALDEDGVVTAMSDG